MIPREIPRWPGPKQTWDAWLTSSAPGATILRGANTTPFDYYIEFLNVLQLESTSGGSSFQVQFQPPGVGSPTVVFWGAEVSATTGTVFTFRGPLRIQPLQDTAFVNTGGGTFAVYVQGFFTNSGNEL